MANSGGRCRDGMSVPAVMTRRRFLRLAAAGTVLSAGRTLRRPGDEASGRPNVLYVFADQMRFCALGCAGERAVATPHLDRLASQGILFENAFSCTPLCSPYRAQILTGRYGTATGVYKNGIPLPAGEVTLAERLKQAGYATGYIGKWHLNGSRAGAGDDADGDGRGQFVPPPARQGFDFWAASECRHAYFDGTYFRDTAEPLRIAGFEPDGQTDLAVDFLKRNRTRPFLLMLAFGPPHAPYTPPPGFAVYDPARIPLRPNVPKADEAEARRDLAAYYGLVSALDAAIGRLMKALEDLGLRDDTIVCFTSDHGDMLGSQGRALKQNPWEESIHIPFLLRYPRKIAAGQRRDVLLGSVDVMPTLLGLCGLEVPPTVQGRDLSPVLSGRKAEEPPAVFFQNDALGPNSPPWQWRGVRTKDWMYAVGAAGPWLLYHVKEDPFEMKNLVDDPKAAAKRKELEGLLQAWRRRIGDTAALRSAGPPRPPGNPALAQR